MGVVPTTLAFPRAYQVYGIRIRTAWPLACPRANGDYLASVKVFESRRRFPERLSATNGAGDPEDWVHRRLPDGSDYLRWGRLAEFRISPAGSTIAARPLDGPLSPSARTFLLSQVLSFALLKRGIETLHAAVIEVAGEAVAFVGNCGTGKSTLAAACLRTGARLLTDDLLVLEFAGGSPPRILAHPGFPRIKLMADSARALIGNGSVGRPLLPGSDKLVFPLARHHCVSGPRPLRAIFVLSSPVASPKRRRVTIRRLSRRRACLTLIANAFNLVVTDPSRLARQFGWAAAVAATVPVKSLAYPRDLSQLPSVLGALYADLGK